MSVPRSGAAATVTSRARLARDLARPRDRDRRRPWRGARRGAPVRVGFTPRFRTVTSEPGSAAAPQRKNAAEEMSPGTSIRPPRGARRARRSPSSPSTRTGDAHPASMRSVWSRDRSGSATVVSPVGEEPGEEERALHLRARDREDVARAAQRSRRARPRRQPVAVARGEVRAHPAERIDARGAPGGARSEASPVSTDSPGTPARTPVRSRRLVPELPQSMTSPGSREPLGRRQPRALAVVHRWPRAPRPPGAWSGRPRRRGAP